MVKAQNEKGEPVQLELQGWLARIFQHEYDHLQVSLGNATMPGLRVQGVPPCVA